MLAYRNPYFDILRTPITALGSDGYRYATVFKDKIRKNGHSNMLFKTTNDPDISATVNTIPALNPNDLIGYISSFEPYGIGAGEETSQTTKLGAGKATLRLMKTDAKSRQVAALVAISPQDKFFKKNGFSQAGETEFFKLI